MTGNRFVLAFVALWLAALCVTTAAPASEPAQSEGVCFEIIVPERGVPPARPLMFNKCTGATWVLVGRYATARHGGRARRLVYRWVSVDADRPVGTAREKQSPAAATAILEPPISAPAGSRQRCFVFAGRHFCE
jgi:hypothetical protein